MYDIIKKQDAMCTYYLYNNEFETMPSLLGSNVVDLIYQASDLGMEYLCVRYYDRSGNPVCYRYRIIPDKLGGPPHLCLIK